MNEGERRTRVSSPRLAVLLAALSCGCQNEEVEWIQAAPNQQGGKPQPKSADRLPPGELLEGPDEVFGFAIPKGMEVRRPSKRLALAEGRVHFDALTDYVKDRISARHAEMLPNKLVFPAAHIRGTKDKVFEITIREQARDIVLEIRDTTKLPPTHGLTEEQRWKKAGMKPSGGLIDPHAME